MLIKTDSTAVLLMGESTIKLGKKQTINEHTKGGEYIELCEWCENLNNSVHTSGPCH